MTFNAVTLDLTGQVVRWGPTSFDTDGSLNGATEIYHANVGSLIAGLPLRYHKVSAGVLAEMTAPEKAAVDADELDKSQKENIAIGFNALGSTTSDEGRNIALGNNALALVTTGTKNLAMGDFAGSALTGNDGTNIMLGNMGVAGDTKAIRIGTSGLHNFTSLVGSLNLVDEQYEAPTSGSTVTASDNTSVLIVEPAGTLATLTIDMPASPRDGQMLNLVIIQVITALTMNGNGATLLAPLNGATVALTRRTWYYREANTTWYPLR